MIDPNPYPIEDQMRDAEANWLIDPRDNDDKDCADDEYFTEADCERNE